MRRRRLRQPCAPLKDLQRKRPSNETLLFKLGAAKKETGRGEYEPRARPAPDQAFDHRIAWQATMQDQPLSLVMGRLVPVVACPAGCGQSPTLVPQHSE